MPTAARSEAALRCFASTASGLEAVTAGELRALGAAAVRTVPGGCFFACAPATVYAALLWLRSASRLLRIIAEFPCPDAAALHGGARAVNWSAWVAPERRFAVRVRLNRAPFMSAPAMTLRIKDAIVDRVRADTGRRPSVDKRHPEVGVQAWWQAGRCVIAVDAAGMPLFMRGYRAHGGGAPLKETLAAGLVLLTGWCGDSPFYDLMCGAGTLPIEAALVAGRRAPGLLRPRAAVRLWPDHDEAAWQAARRAAKARARPVRVPIFAADRDARAIRAARHHARRAGVADAIDFAVQPASAFRPPSGAGLILINPPYGERLGDEPGLLPVYRELGDLLKQRANGKDAWLLTRPGALLKAVGLRSARRLPVYNGALECRLVHFPLYRGSRKGPAPPSIPASADRATARRASVDGVPADGASADGPVSEGALPGGAPADGAVLSAPTR